MLKRVLTAVAALIMAASISATALAAPAPTDNPYMTQLKTIKADVNALRKTLATERTNDRKLLREIRTLKSRVKIDKAQLQAYQAELKPLQTEYKALAAKLKDAIKSKDADAIAKAKADLVAMKQKIAAVKAKYPAVAKALATKRTVFSDAKTLKEQLLPKYNELAPLAAKSACLFHKLDSLSKQLKAAVKAGNDSRCDSLITKIQAQTALVKDNLSKRLEIRKEITKLILECKVTLTK